MKNYLLLSAVLLLATACSMTQVRTIETYHSEPVPANSSELAVEAPLAVPAAPAEVPPPSLTALDEVQLQCLALNMYHEARGEGSRGMLAVGFVTVNRTEVGGWPKTICGVVRDGVHRNGRVVYRRCQFSWYCDGRSDAVTNRAQYEQAETLARSILTKQAVNPVGRSVFFHNGQVRPKWRRVVFHCRIGGHRFYRKA